ncbi:MAG TPA: hypothetical protein VFA75_14280, partial [Nevskia sp.]|nr:hypothetical protein [Nevskia sp.]
MIGLAAQAQVLRSQGQNLRERAAEARSNAEILRGNLALVRRGVAQSEQGVQTAEGHLAFRRDLAMKAEQALQASEQKAETVAQQAPEGVEKAAEGKQQTGPMAGDARQLAAENSANTPDDDEAAENAREQGDKLNRVSSDTGTVDDAVTQAQNAAGTLVQDAAHAKQVNTQTRGRLDGVHQTLEQTGERLGEMQGQNAQAQAQVETLEDQPDAFAAQAEQLDAEGQALIQSSMEIEARLQQIQQDYAAGMKSVPGVELPPEGGGAPGAELFVQRAVAEAAPPSTINLAEGLPSWLTGEPEQTAQQRREAQDREEQRRQAAIQEIYDRAGGDFSRLSAADKIDIALQQTGRNLFGGISNISWPGWGGIARGAGHLAAGLIDPRGPMMGVVSGLNMIVNGVASFVRAPSWGGLLKMAADIATGLTIILGSITALAGVIIAIMTAITILSFGTAAPVTGPIIAFCATVMSTVGGWTIAVGEVALLLQELVFLKNLYEAATAQTAEELQRQSDNMTADARAAGNVVLQMGMAKLAQVGGRNLQSAVAREGGGVAFARTLGSEGLPAQIRSGIREAGGVRAYAGEALAGARGAVAEAGGVGRYALGAGGRFVTGAGRTIRSTVRELTGEAPAGLSARQGFSREFLVGEGRPPGGAALAAEPRAPVVAEAPRVAEPAPPPRPAEAAPPPPERLQGGAPVDPAESQLLQGTRAKSGAQLSPQEVRSELGVAQRARGRPIHEGPYVEEVTLPNGHNWRRTEEGVWCRFSPGPPDCFGLGPSGPAPVAEPAPPAAPKPAPPGQQATPTTVTTEPPTAPRPAEPDLPPAAAQRAAPRPAERFTVSSQAEVQRLRANPPQRPANLDVEGQQLWEDYFR